MNWNKSISVLSIIPCQLGCFFCISGNDFKVPHQVWQVDKFKELIDMLMDHGFDNIDLTPVVGDIFQDPGIYEKLNYLAQKNLFYEVVSNILSLKKDKVADVLNYKNMELAISIYGWDHKSYLKSTRMPKFDLFMKKLKLIQAHPGKLCNVRLYLRNGDWKEIPNSELKSILEDIFDRGATIEDAELTNKNWGGHLSHLGPKLEKKGLCNRFIFENGIYPNGDITLCNCWDWDKFFIIGNIYEQSLDEIYNLDTNEKLHNFIKKHVISQYEGPCVTCNDFYQTDRTWGYEWIKRYEMLYKKSVIDSMPGFRKKDLVKG